jgi:hypothetical protein
MSTISSLEVRLNDLLVGYLTHYPDEKAVFVVDEGYIEYGEQRPILSLSLARPNDEEITRALLADDRHKSASVKAPPFFSNLGKCPIPVVILARLALSFSSSATRCCPMFCPSLSHQGGVPKPLVRCASR